MARLKENANCEVIPNHIYDEFAIATGIYQLAEDYVVKSLILYACDLSGI